MIRDRIVYTGTKTDFDKVAEEHHKQMSLFEEGEDK